MIFWLIGTYVLLVLQTTCGPMIAIGPFQPNVMIALCVPCFCQSQSRWALCGAAVWGLCIDALGSGPLGINLFSFTLIAASFRPRDVRQADSPLRVILLTALAVVFLMTVELAAQWPWKQMMGRWSEFTIFVAGNSLYTFGVGLMGIAARVMLRHLAARARGVDGRKRAWGRAVLHH